MNHRASYFHRRRQRLRRQKLCVRCGAEKAKAGHMLCPGCLGVMIVKKSRPAPETAVDRKIKRLVHRLDLIDEARRAVQEEIDRLTA